MRLVFAILLAAIAPAGASLADQAQMTLRGSKSEKEEPADVVSTVTKGSRNRPVKTNAMGDDGSRKRNQRKNGGDGNVDERFVAVPKEAAAVTVGEIETVAKLKPIKKNDYIDKATYRAQKKAERAAELAEKESEREAEKALREAKKADKEAKKAELKAEKAQQEAEQPAEKDGKKKKKAALKKRLEAADNSTSIDEAEDESSNLSLLSDEDGWMPTPSPIEVLTPWPTEPPVALICPDEFDPERTEPYKAGDHVTVEASIFECQAGDFEEFCSIAELTNDIKKEHKDAKKLWKEAWKYVSPCTAAESASDELVEVNDTVEAETEDTSVIEIVDDEDVAVEAEIEGEVAIDGAVDIDSLLQPRSAGLEQHNWDMGFEFADEPCVSDVCMHQISDICLLHYQVNAPQGNEPSTITMELICEGVTWLGIGFSQDGLMAGSEAVIGVLGQKPRKYNLDGRYMGGVKPMDDSQQTLIDASINVYRGPITVLKFTKIMREQGEIELSPGDNTFLYAQGQSYFLGQHAHDSRGSFQLNLPSVEAPVVDMERSFDDVTETAITTVAPTTTVMMEQPCTTEWCVEELGTECVLKYVVNYPFDEPSSITMDFTCAGEAWIGIGFSLDGIMDGSEAVIAGVGQEPRKYHLGGKWFGPGGVGEMPESQQTLIDTKVRVKWVEGSNGLVPLMKMRFTKLLSEPNEIEIRPGENLFLYAQGSTPSFPSYHAARDSFALTLSSNGPDSGADTSATVAPAAPEMQVTELSDECTLKHVVNVPAYTTRDECEDCSVTMELTCDSVAWVAVGFSVDGFMPRSEAVIGIPGRNPEKYFLKRRNINRIFRLPDEAQTLTDASVTVDDGETVMRFTKMLNEPEEILITQGLYFLFAFGRDENFGYHGPNSRGRFRLKW
mmetsp:Transcript_21025/g.42008  ORF Transcript_21025/g.42008 Transcript_21025/m.42008 type:complete len:898 (+) Transcript_21025:395-3088(+)